MYNFKEDNILRKDELEMDFVSPKRRIGGQCSVNYAILHLKTWILVTSYARDESVSPFSVKTKSLIIVY